MGSFCGGPQDKDYGILGVYIGAPLLRETSSFYMYSEALGIAVNFRRPYSDGDRILSAVGLLPGKGLEALTSENPEALNPKP